MAKHWSLLFNIRTEMWNSYSEWLWCYFSANNIKDHGRSDPYADCMWIIYMPAPQKPPTPGQSCWQNLQWIKPNLEWSLQSVFSTITRISKSSESIATYVAERKPLGEYCGSWDQQKKMFRHKSVQYLMITTYGICSKKTDLM